MQHETQGASSRDEIGGIVERHGGPGGNLIGMLQEIQARYLYLPEDKLRELARSTGRKLVDIYGVATFYNSFSLTPRGKHLVSCCQGTACHVRGAPAIARELQKQLGVGPGETTADKEFTFETVNCLGACALGPVVVVDGKYHSGMSAPKVGEVLDGALHNNKVARPGEDLRMFPLHLACPSCNHSLLDRTAPVDGYPSIHVTASFGEQHGWVRLSSVYGSYTVESKHEIPPDTVVTFFCPHCHAELIGGTTCVECEAPMVPMIIRGGGTLQICTRRGCKGHILNLGFTPVS